MSELVPFFDEDEQLDDNLLRSIETLLDDNEQSMDGMGGGKKGNASIGNEMSAPPNSPMPQYETLNGSSFAFGNQVYQKWSTNETNIEVPNPVGGPKRTYNRNQPRPSNFGKSFKKAAMQSAAAGLAAVRVNTQIAQYQAILAEKANQLLNQYLRLNYDSLNAQAQILGISLDQYVRNLMLALNTQSMLTMPLNQPFLYAPINPAQVMPQTPPPSPMTMPNIGQQRAFAKQYFNNKKF